MPMTEPEMTEPEIDHVTTPLLDMAYIAGGPADGPPVLLLHGWPDDAHTWDRVAPALWAAGYKTVAPWWRGFGPTRFLSSQTARSGQMAALAQDALDLANALDWQRFSVIGHDWGARAAYFLAAVAPDRLCRIAALSVGWEPGSLPTPALPQAQSYWYQWFLTTERGAETVCHDGKAFARHQWDNWGPAGWYEEAEFERTAAAFDNPDWAAITLHSYRVRWDEAKPDPRYAELERRQRATRTLSVPTLMIQGGDDRCTLPATTEKAAGHFTGPYRREVLPGVGHFPQREAPEAVNRLLLDFLGTETATP
ncbi:alpha/beta hydrolase [Nitrospirillum sp. BR 11752]|uniref:alpha/beta fold hydrolase n=1 Tax=Nitrospirillum sp. BR 11752 TaxID=3104293 RepID=UPI002EA20BEE|nr:alpha/beta hydrolase [Nitrospirillum sp. BR 11752]